MNRSRARALSLPLFLVATIAGEARGAEPFWVDSLETKGRTVAAEIADFDGDGLGDLLQIAFSGIPPNDERALRVFFQRSGGEIPTAPDIDQPLPGAAAYDLGNVSKSPGMELVLLRASGIAIASFHAGKQPGVEIIDFPTPANTLGAAPDERGLDRLEMVLSSLGDEPWIAVPGLGETFFLSPTGDLRARIDVGGRANFFIEPAGPMLSESDIQLFYDSPRLSIGDIDGDGRNDILGASRHELRIFLRDAAGGFPRTPSQRIALGRVAESDHMRGSGSVRSEASDLDGDGLADLLISETAGSILDARATTSFYRNRGGEWNLEKPDAVFKQNKALTGDQFVDIDGDGRKELMQIRIPVSVLELVELFVTQAIDAYITVYRADSDSGFSERPWFERKVDIGVNFNTGRPVGFLPTLNHDLNGDGVRDYLSSTDGTRIEIFLGGSSGISLRPDAGQDLSTEGVLSAGDLDGDGLVDFALFNPRRADAPMRLLRNLGNLPGVAVRPELRSDPSEP